MMIIYKLNKEVFDLPKNTLFFPSKFYDKIEYRPEMESELLRFALPEKVIKKYPEIFSPVNFEETALKYSDVEKAMGQK